MENKLIDLKFLRNPKETAYFIGFFWADGTINSDKYLVVEITEEDGDCLKNIFNKVADFKITTRRREGRKPQITFFLKDEQATVELKKLGKYPNTIESHEKIISFIPEKYRVYFLRGLIDGDGCFYSGPANKKWKNNTVHFTIGSRYEQDWDGLINFCQNYGLKLTVKKSVSERSHSHSSIVRSSSFGEIKKFIEVLYEENDGVFLKRKKAKIEQAIKEHEKNIAMAEERRKKFKITKNDGEVIVINNLKKFSKENNYNYWCLSKAANGNHRYKDILIEHN